MKQFPGYEELTAWAGTQGSASQYQGIKDERII
jgi:hypothetical protein